MDKSKLLLESGISFEETIYKDGEIIITNGCNWIDPPFPYIKVYDINRNILSRIYMEKPEYVYPEDTLTNEQIDRFIFALGEESLLSKNLSHKLTVWEELEEQYINSHIADDYPINEKVSNYFKNMVRYPNFKYHINIPDYTKLCKQGGLLWISVIIKRN